MGKEKRTRKPTRKLGHRLFNMYAKFSEKLTLLTKITLAYVSVGNRC